MELPRHPSGKGESGNQKQDDQRAQGLSLEAFLDCHKVAGVQARVEAGPKREPTVNTVDKNKFQKKRSSAPARRSRIRYTFPRGDNQTHNAVSETGGSPHEVER
jgi:hypothetical protein